MTLPFAVSLFKNLKLKSCSYCLSKIVSLNREAIQERWISSQEEKGEGHSPLFSQGGEVRLRTKCLNPKYHLHLIRQTQNITAIQIRTPKTPKYQICLRYGRKIRASKYHFHLLPLDKPKTFTVVIRNPKISLSKISNDKYAIPQNFITGLKYRRLSNVQTL